MTEAAKRFDELVFGEVGHDPRPLRLVLEDVLRDRHLTFPEDPERLVPLAAYAAAFLRASVEVVEGRAVPAEIFTRLAERFAKGLT